MVPAVTRRTAPAAPSAVAQCHFSGAGDDCRGSADGGVRDRGVRMGMMMACARGDRRLMAVLVVAVVVGVPVVMVHRVVRMNMLVPLGQV